MKQNKKKNERKKEIMLNWNGLEWTQHDNQKWAKLMKIKEKKNTIHKILLAGCCPIRIGWSGWARMCVNARERSLGRWAGSARQREEER